MAEYVGLGLPAPDRTWSPDDLAKAADVLEKLAEDDRAKLPRADSPRSGVVYTRLLSQKNLDFQRNVVEPLKMRAQKSLAHQKALERIRQLYAVGWVENATGDRECFESINAMLISMQKLHELLNSLRSRAAVRGDVPPEADDQIEFQVDSAAVLAFESLSLVSTASISPPKCGTQSSLNLIADVTKAMKVLLPDCSPQARAGFIALFERMEDPKNSHLAPVALKVSFDDLRLTLREVIKDSPTPSPTQAPSE